jgi:hypothetical protein
MAFNFDQQPLSAAEPYMQALFAKYCTQALHETMPSVAIDGSSDYALQNSERLHCTNTGTMDTTQTCRDFSYAGWR